MTCGGKCKLVPNIFVIPQKVVFVDMLSLQETLMKEAGNMKPGSSPDQLKDALKNIADKYGAGGGGHTEL